MENQPNPMSKPNAGQNMGIAALVLGIIAVVLAFVPCTAPFAGFPSLLAIIFGAIGYNQAKKGNAKKGLPLAGLILGIISAVFIAVWLTIFAEGVMALKEAAEQDSTMMQNLDSAFQQLDSAMQAADSTANK